jgi:hypothetical protein
MVIPYHKCLFFYFRANPTNGQPLEINNIASIAESSFYAAKTTVFLAHGWRGDGDNDMNTMLTAGILTNLNFLILSMRSKRVRRRKNIICRLIPP